MCLVTTFTRILRAPLLAGLLLLPVMRARAQAADEVAVVRDGVRFLVRPSITITTTPGGVVQVQLGQINARVDESAGIVVDGVAESYTAFNRGLVAGFNALRVTSLSLGVTFDGVEGCSGRVSYATWREGGRETLGCNAGSEARLTGFTVNGLSTSGLLELQAEVRRLRRAAQREDDARAQQERDESLARARRDEAARPSGQSSRASGAATENGPTGDPAATRRSTPEDARRQAEAARRRQEAEAQAEEARRAAAAMEQQRRELNASLDQAATQLAGVVVNVLDDMARNRRLEEARRQREALAREARVAAYRAAALTRYANAPEAPLCAGIAVADVPRVEFGTPISGELSMASCRTDDGRNAAVHRVRVPARYWVAVEWSGDVTGTVQVVGADGQRVNTGADFWIEPGEYTVQLLTAIPGEVGRYTIGLERSPRAAVGDWFWGVGGEQFSPGGGFMLEGGGSALILRTGLRLSPFAELIGESAVGSGLLTGEVGGRVYLQGILSRTRVFVQGTYGYFAVERVSRGSFDSGRGTGVTAGIGWEYTVTTSKNPDPGTVEVGVYQTNAALTGDFESPFKSLRLRAALNLHFALK